MLEACHAALPADIAVCAAAVADWHVVNCAPSKCKKEAGAPPPTIQLAANPDILATLSEAGPNRPPLVVGFAAETEQLVPNAVAKRARKGCDWIIANDVSPNSGTFGGDNNSIHLISAVGTEEWPRLSKSDVAQRLAKRIAAAMAKQIAAAMAEPIAVAIKEP